MENSAANAGACGAVNAQVMKRQPLAAVGSGAAAYVCCVCGVCAVAGSAGSGAVGSDGEAHGAFGGALVWDR